jgi:nitrogen regulatory protein PII-like uncharacterized protein
MCIDMGTAEGRDTLVDLAKISEDVRTALTIFGEKVPDGFFLALHLTGVPRMVVGICAREDIRKSIKLFHDRSLELGNTFSIAIIPPDYAIAAMVAEITATAGSA